MSALTREWLERNRWVWSFLGVLVLWAILSIATSRFSLHSLSGVAASASFLDAGRARPDAGGDDGSRQYRSLHRQRADAERLRQHRRHARALTRGCRSPSGRWWLIGLVTGAVNALLVVPFRIPAIIATLATGYILATGTPIANRWAAASRSARCSKTLAAGRIDGFPVMLLIALLAVAAGRLRCSAAPSAWPRRLGGRAE